MISKQAVFQPDISGTHDGGHEALPERYFVIVTVLIILLGGLLAWWLVERADSGMRADLLSQTRLMAGAVNLKCVGALTGTKADLASPEYLRLKEQFAALRNANPQIGFLYLLGRNNEGKLFFYIDSEPAGSKDYSPPGQVYDEASEGYRKSFATSTAAVIGPATDRWGTWVSALVPLQEHQAARQGLGTTAAAKAIVQKAVVYYRKNGRARLLQEINNPQGAFRQGDLYVFAYDRGMTMQAHPVTPELVGKNQLDMKDWTGGKYFRREIQEIALTKGNGWVDYEYENPVSKAVEPKTTYLALVDDLIICAGAYKGTVAVRALLCMDIDARNWNMRLVPAALPAILLALILCTILWTGRMLLRRRFRLAAAQPSWMRYLEPALAIAAGLTLTLFFAWVLSANELREHKDVFEQLAASRTEAIAKTLLTLRDTELEGLALFLEGSTNVTSGKFRQYSSYLTKNQAIAAWEWIPAVPHADKERFISAARTSGLPGFEIWQKDAQGKRIPATGREVYYPVFCAEPLAGNKKALGYDLGSDALRRAALALAMQTGLATGTEPITLVQETGGQKGMLIYRPVFGNDTTRPRGFALAVLRMGTILQSGNPDKTALLDIALLRKDAPPEPLAVSWDADSKPAAGISMTRIVFAFGKAFAVTAHAGPEFTKAHPQTSGIFALLIGFLLTAGFAALLHLSRSRREELERQVALQTIKLSESEERHRLLIDHALSAIALHEIVLDAAGRPVDYVFLNANPAFETHTGLRVADVLGRRVTGVLPGIEKTPFVEIYGKVALTGEPVSFEQYSEPLRRHYAVSAYRVGEGRFATVFADITERKQAEEILKESEQRFDLALSGTGAGLWDWDMVKDTVFFSPRWKSILGYEDHEVANAFSGWKDLWHPDDAARIEQALNDHLAGKTATYEIEHRLRHKDGGWRWILTRGDIQKDATGTPVRWTGTNLDITERKRAEDELRKINSKWETILSSSPDGIGTVSLDGKLQYVSDKLLTMFGYSAGQAEELSGSGLLDFLDPACHEKAISSMGKLLANETTTSFNEYLAIRKDNSRFYLELKSAVLPDASGWPENILFIGRDITERKRSEQALLDTNLDLQESIVKAEMANMAKSEFLANMSHELRTPMNGVIGMTGLLLSTELNDDQRRYAEIVRASGDSLLALLNDILDFSKIEAKKLDLEIMDFDLRAMLEDFADVQALRASEKGLEFICWAAPDVPSLLRGDPGRLRQILVNLAGNAVKFTHQGEIAVRASLLLATDNDVIVRFSIKDTGIGIPADKQNMLFQKFTQVDASVTRKFGGTGLGLAISKQLSEMMGGDIGLTSHAGKGSEFWFTARFARQTGKAVTVTPLADISGMRILVVDDNATNREVLLSQLAGWGVAAGEAPDGLSALAALHAAKDAQKPFLGAILDMQMPGMNGEELAVAIKADDAIQDTRLIMMTSMTQRGDARRMEEIGFAAYLTKPARQSDLYSCLMIVLSGKSITQEPKQLVTKHTIREMRKGIVRILLAEDNIINQQVAAGLLENLGLRADAVANGSEAVKALRTIPYDLVLMDCMMPEMDGYEATRVIRNPQSAVLNHEIPIIAMTANALQGDREKCLAAGMNDYVSKPVDARALAEALEKWLPNEGRKDESPISNTQFPTDEGKKKRLTDERETKDEYPMSNKEFPTDEVVNAGRARDLVSPLGGQVMPLHGEGNKSLDIGHSLLDIGHSNLPIFDLDGMLHRLMGDEVLVRKLIAGFIDDIPKQIRALRAYLAAGDVNSTQRQAHTIKGASANMGGEALRALAFEMEKEAWAGNLNYVTARLPELEAQFKLLKKEMKKYAKK